MPATTSPAISPSSSPSAIRSRRAIASAGACDGVVVGVRAHANDERRAGVCSLLWTSPSHAPRALMGLLFFPRGGSAHVARNLARRCPAPAGTSTVAVRLGHASRPPGRRGEFYARARRPPGRHDGRARVRPTRCARDPPMHPSYEDRPGAPDRVFARSTTRRPSTRSSPGRGRCSRPARPSADVLHLHHLTPINEAAARVAPQRAGRRPPARHRAADARGDRGRPGALAATARPGPSGCAAGRRLRAAHRALRVPDRPRRAAARRRPRAARAGPERLRPRAVRARAHVDRAALWRRLLVEEPRGWAPGASPARSATTDAPRPSRRRARAALRRPLHRGQAAAAADRGLRARPRPGFARRAPLVLVGGFPGEWEGEHPLDAIRRLGAQDVYLAGWHEHRRAAGHPRRRRRRRARRRCASSSARCSWRAWRAGCRRSPSTRYGPADIVEHGRTGWLVEPDDVDGLADALVEAVNRPASAAAAARRPRDDVAERFAWPALARARRGDLRVPRERSLREDPVSSRERCVRRRQTLRWAVRDAVAHCYFSLPSEPSVGASLPPPVSPAHA